MTAILELIKALIPFAIAFLFLWGIGRICCTNSTAKKKPQQEKTDESDEDEQAKQQQLKAELKKKHRKKKRKEMFADKQTLASGKRDLMSREKMMDHKSDMFSTKRSLIGQREDRTSALNVILTPPSGKKRKRISLQQAFLLKEVLDAPKAIKPYRSKYPR